MPGFTLDILTLLIFLPAVGAVVILLLPRGRDELYRVVAFACAGTTFLVSCPLFWLFDGRESGAQFDVKVPWIPSIGASYHIGIDGLSLLLVLLTTFLTAISILASWRAITKRVKAYMACFLLLETGILGTFVALDLVLFYIFWEAMLIPMYFLIGVWGGPDRIYAAMKFFLYTMFGSVLMLVGILVLYFHQQAALGIQSFDVLKMLELNLPMHLQLWLFAAFGVAFAIKVPLFPFHTWLPDAHVEAPTAGSVILAGVLLKIGIYGFARFCLPLFPAAAQVLMPYVAVLAVIGIVYGALVALVQPDVKKLVAYSSVSHLGFVVLGLFAFNLQGAQGAVIQMVNHGLSTGALFLIVGMLYERRHTRLIADYGGLYKPMPILGTFFIIIVLSSLGLPGLNGFVGEFLILVGVFETARVFAILAATGVLLTAIYLLWMYQRVMHGPIERPENEAVPDLNAREIGMLLPIVVLCFWIGLYPKPFLERTEATMRALVARVAYEAETPVTVDQQGLGSQRISERAAQVGHQSAVSFTRVERGFLPPADAPRRPRAPAPQPARRGVPE